MTVNVGLGASRRATFDRMIEHERLEAERHLARARELRTERDREIEQNREPPFAIRGEPA